MEAHVQYIVEVMQGNKFVADSIHDRLIPAKKRCGMLVARSAGKKFRELPRVIERKVVLGVCVNGKRLIEERVVG